MRFKFSVVTATVFITAASATAAIASGNPVHYTDQGTFEALGTIDQLTNFDNYLPPAIFDLGTHLSSGILSVDSAQNYVVTEDTGSTNTRPLLAEHYPGLPGTPDTMTFTITQPGENLFAFKLGDLNFPGSASLVINTNAGFYEIGLDDPLALNLAFNGILAPVGEYFTSFAIFGNNEADPTTQAMYFNMPAVTDIEIGHTVDIPSTAPPGGVPEPATWGLMIFGFGLAGAVLRRRRVTVAA